MPFLPPNQQCQSIEGNTRPPNLISWNANGTEPNQLQASQHIIHCNSAESQRLTNPLLGISSWSSAGCSSANGSWTITQQTMLQIVCKYTPKQGQSHKITAMAGTKLYCLVTEGIAMWFRLSFFSYNLSYSYWFYNYSVTVTIKVN